MTAVPLTLSSRVHAATTVKSVIHPSRADGVVAEIAAHGWKHVDTGRFLDHQFFAVFEPR